MIEVDAVSKSFGSVRALNGVSFRVEPGERVGLLGPNGAGKTTLMRILSTYRSPDDGSAQIHRYDTVTESLAARRHLGYLPESVPLYEDLTAEAHLRYRGRLKQMQGRHLEDRIDTVLSACGLDDLASRPVSALSKGYRKRLGLADALLSDPAVLLLDEPTEGLDPNQVRDTRDLIGSLSETTTLLLSTHILADVRAVCDRVLILGGGKLRYDDAVDPADRSAGLSYRVTVQSVSVELEQSMRSIPEVQEVNRRDSTEHVTYHIVASSDIRAGLFATCCEHDVPVLELTREGEPLQHIFARYTEEAVS